MTSRMSRLLMAITLLCMLHGVTSQEKCPSGFIEIDEFCYLLGSGLKTFYDAVDTCEDVGSILVEPRSGKINNVTKQFATQARNNVYIGLIRDGGIFVWESDDLGHPGPGYSYRDWAPGEPGGEQCAVMRSDTFQWNDFDCKLATSYLCQARKRLWVEDKRTQKSYLVLNTTTLAHDVVQTKCQQYGGILPEPRSQQENDFLDGLGTEMFLLGMNDKVTEGTWVWDSDGSEVIFTNWWPGQPGLVPKQSPIDQDCAVMMKNFFNAADKWADLPCSIDIDQYMDRNKKSLICQRRCNDGSFGKDCKFICNCAEETEVCDKITGICPKSGCKTGFSEESGCQDRTLLWWAIVASSALLAATIFFSISYWLYIKHKNQRKIKSTGSQEPTETETSQTQSRRSGESGTLTESTVTSDSMSTGRESESLSHSGKTDFLSWWNTPTSKLTEKPTSII